MKVSKRFLKRLLFVITLVIVLSNCYYIISGSNTVFAAKGIAGTIFSFDTGFGEKIEALMSGLVGIVTLLPRLFCLLLGFFMKLIMNACISLGTHSFTSVTFERIFFSGYKGPDYEGLSITDINFFDLTGNDAIHSFRTAVAQWYYILRMISAAILLVILIYVGIRMALSTIASEQAKYKQMLVDWITSLALLFLLHYIIILFISINSALVSGLANLLPATQIDSSWYVTVASNLDEWTGGIVTVGDYLNDQLVGDIWTDGIGGMFAAIMYVIMQGSAFGFFLFYLKRMITVGFLIIIAPLITITYSIDKIGDGKAQALNAWLKELVYNILIQPFHCVIYLAFFGAITQIIADSRYGSIVAYILAFVVLKFIKEAEGLLRKIFHFQAHSMPSITEPAKTFAAATGKFAQIGMKAGSAFSNFRAAGGTKAIRNGIRDMHAKKDVQKEFEAGEVQTDAKTFKEFKGTEEYKKLLERKRTAREINAHKNERRTEKARKIYDKKNGPGSYDTMIDAEARKAYDAKNGTGAYDAMKQKSFERDKDGRLTQEAKDAQRIINSQKEIARQSKNGEIISSVGVRKKINGAKTAIHTFTQSEAGKAVVGYAEDSMKIASALTLGGFAYGMTGNMTDALSFGQLGYGIAYGALEGTNKTATDDTVELIRQYAHNNNVNPEEMKKTIQQFVDECHSMDFAGMFKKIHDNQVEAVKKLREVVGNDATKIMSEMIAQTRVGMEYDISNLVDTYSTKDLNDKDKEKAVNIVKDFSDLLIKSQVASHYNVVRGGGMDVDSFGRKVTNHYNSTTNNSVNYIYNHEEKKYENKFQVNPDEARRRSTQTNNGGNN